MLRANMKCKIKKIFYSLLCISVLSIISWSVLASKLDVNQPVIIDSLKQVLDIFNNVSIFTDNVAITQGSIDIHADKAVVVYSSRQQNKTYIETFGNPVIFHQRQDNGKLIKGCAQEMRYDIKTQTITLTGNAYLEHLDNNVKGDRITYLVQQHQMQAFSDKGKHVTMILLPSQLKD